MMNEDAGSMAITGSAAPWDGGTWPAFAAVNAVATSGEDIGSPEADTSTNDQPIPNEQQQLCASPILPPHPPQLKRKLQLDHCKDAIDVAFNAHKQRRLQMMDEAVGEAVDLRFEPSSSSLRRRKTSEYAGLVPSSRSSKQLLAAADAQLYRRRGEKKMSKTSGASAGDGGGESAKSKRSESPSKMLSSDALSGAPSAESPWSKWKGPTSSPQASPERSPSVRTPKQPPTTPLSPHTSESLESSQEDGAAPTENDAVKAVQAARRDSSVVQLRTPEVLLLPTTPPKMGREANKPNDPQQEALSPPPKQHLSVFDDSLSSTEAPHDAGAQQGGVAQLQLTSSAALSPPALTSGAKAGEEEEEEEGSLRGNATAPPLLLHQQLPSFRRTNSRVSLKEPENDELERTSSTIANEGGKKRHAWARGADATVTEGQKGPARHRPVHRVSSSAMISVVWVKPPCKPSSTSHRALLRQQQPQQRDLEKKPRKQSGGKGGPGKRQKPRNGCRPPSCSESQATDAEDERNGDNDTAARESLAWFQRKKTPAAYDSRNAEGDGERVQTSRKASRKASVNCRRRSSAAEKGQQQKKNCAAERLPPLAGNSNRHNSRCSGAAVPTDPSGTQPLTHRNSIPADPPYTRGSYDVSNLIEARKKNDGTQPLPDSLSHTLEAVLARHPLTAEKPPSMTPYPPCATAGVSCAASQRTAPLPPCPPAFASSSSSLVYRADANAVGTEALRVNSVEEAVATDVDTHLNPHTTHDPTTVVSALSQKSRPLFPSSLPAHQRGMQGATRTSGPRFSASVKATAATTEVQRFAPLVVVVDASTAGHRRSRRQPLSLSSAPQRSLTQTHGEVLDLFGHSRQAKTKGGLTEKKPTRTSSRDAAEKSDKSSNSLQSHSTAAAESRDAPTVESHPPPGYPTVRLPRATLPRTRRSPTKAEDGEGKGARDASVKEAPSVRSAPPKHTQTPPPPSPPIPPTRPPVPRLRHKKKLNALDRQLVGYAFAPYMAGMPSLPDGRVRYNPAIEVYLRHDAHRTRRMKQTNNKKKGNRQQRQPAGEQQSVAATTTRKPVDYAALATQKDPLDYLLGRHGFWGEATTW